MDSAKLLEELRIAVDRRLIDFISEYRRPESLYIPMQYVLEGQGKRIRPILLLLVNQAYDGDQEQAYHAALALEVLHNFTLVHDDIMDEDFQRRGRPTVHKKWDLSTAILSGDGLLGLAYRSLLTTKSEEIHRLLQVFTDGVIDICEGQAYDKEFERRDSVTITEYIDMIHRKTGRLLSMCCEMGALLAGASEQSVKDCRSFGYIIGEAFQVQDDLLEVTSTMEVAGKSLGSDLFSQKKTFIFLKTLELADEEELRRINEILEQDIHTEQDFEQLKRIARDLGVIDVTKNYIDEKLYEAKALLNTMPVDTTHIEYLIQRLQDRQS
jgi:geranylgeranyl diphosphate synthase type II